MEMSAAWPTSGSSRSQPDTICDCLNYKNVNERMNYEWLNYTIYILTRETRGSSGHSCFIRTALSWSGRMWAIIPLLVEWELDVFPSNHGDFCPFLQRALHGMHCPRSRRFVVQWLGHMRFTCVLFESSILGIVFNPITDHSQLAKDIDSYFKSQLCGGPYTKPSTHFTLLAE